MRSKPFTTGLAIAFAAGCAGTAIAQVKPEQLVDQRVAAMRLQGKYLYPLVPMAQGRVPYDAAIVARNAGYLDVLIKLAWDGFDPVTKDVKSRALPEIYSDPTKFKAAIDTMYAEMTKFQATVKAGNEANTKTAIVDLNKACNGCHETFRQKPPQ
jgi:cytochrome c556